MENETPVYLNLKKDLNNSDIFEVYFYRELFMELRKQLDDLYSKREKSEQAYAKYDDAVYNITANAITHCGAQDFMGFCYKKGFYDFCLMNYDKYMKWTVLAASNGNAFSLSKLQIYLTTSLDSLYSIPNLDIVYDFLDLTQENFTLYLSKLLCDEIVKILEISPEALVKMPEKFLEQTEETQKVFDRAKIQAEKIVSENLKRAIAFLNEEYEKKRQKEKEKLDLSKKKIQEEIEASSAPEEQEQPQEQEKQKTHRSFKKKFRY